MVFLLDKIKIFLSAGSKHIIEDIPSSVVAQVEQEGFVLVDEYISCRMQGFYRNYVFRRVHKGGSERTCDAYYKELEGTVYIGVKHNSYKEAGEGFKKVCIEYNPQKVDFPIALRMYFSVMKYKYCSVKKCDIAIDFENRTLNDFSIATRRKIMYVGQANNLTRYIAPQDNHGRIKIYDKTKERCLHGEQIPQTVRLEITLKDPFYHEYEALDLREWTYLEDIAKRISEVSCVTDLPLLPSEEVNKAILYLLSKVSDLEREEAYSLMSHNSAAKYRKQIRKTDFMPIQVDIVDFAQKTSVQIWQAITDTCGIVRFV